MSSSHPDQNLEKPPLHTARSFPRMESSDASPFARTRSRTVQSLTESVDSDALPLPLSGDDEDQNAGADLFERRDSSESGAGDDGQQGDEGSVLSRNIQDQPEELPIELMSLTDRYCETFPEPCDTNY